ncbi:GNAT family N-acetyltransferase [Prevotella sp. MGM2]|uniref:GNAT family N-acetyltransferase n=1 Tax=Prevotella sp. MGM2 TaxID=2033406 RepID=UPI000D0BEECF|nr:gNAT family acetyltransferase [Prevotella sp. MGM2]
MVALYVEEDCRGHNLGQVLIDRAIVEAELLGFKTYAPCFRLDPYYEKFGFRYLGSCYHPWGEESRLYQIDL